MCGRFVGYRGLEELAQYFPIDRADCEAAANYNVAPSRQILAIAKVDGLNVLDKYHWGLVPFWARDTAVGARMINARAETVPTKPSFRDAFKKRRCLIPADGFYEWQEQKGGKQPVYFTLPDEAPFAFAGLWETWHDEASPRTPYRSCTIITTEAAGAVRTIHHRMPVVLQPNAYAGWLADSSAPLELQEMLRSNIVTHFAFRPVSKEVNSVRTNDPSNIKPIQMELDFQE